MRCRKKYFILCWVILYLDLAQIAGFLFKTSKEVKTQDQDPPNEMSDTGSEQNIENEDGSMEDVEQEGDEERGDEERGDEEQDHHDDESSHQIDENTAEPSSPVGMEKPKVAKKTTRIDLKTQKLRKPRGKVIQRRVVTKRVPRTVYRRRDVVVNKTKYKHVDPVKYVDPIKYVDPVKYVDVYSDGEGQEQDQANTNGQDQDQDYSEGQEQSPNKDLGQRQGQGQLSNSHNMKPTQQNDCRSPDIYHGWTNIRSFLLNADNIDIIVFYMLWCCILMSMTYIGTIWRALKYYFLSNGPEDPTVKCVPVIHYYKKTEGDGLESKDSKTPNELTEPKAEGLCEEKPGTTAMATHGCESSWFKRRNRPYKPPFNHTSNCDHKSHPHAHEHPPTPRDKEKEPSPHTSDITNALDCFKYMAHTPSSHSTPPYQACSCSHESYPMNGSSSDTLAGTPGGSSSDISISDVKHAIRSLIDACA